MLTQTAAIFLDAYRELNAKKLFWVVLLITLVVVLAMAAVGYSEEGNLRVLWFDTPIPLRDIGWTPDILYKALFASVGIPIWLAWGATILALVSTAGIFPDFISSGSIDLALSKPIGRLRLFLTKYLAAMLFVVLQVTVFSVGAFLIIGIRGGAWEPSLLLAIPIVTLFFSYLFGVCVLLGVLTRSTITALLVTIIFWLLIFVVHSTEQSLLAFRTQYDVRAHWMQTDISRIENRIGEREARQSGEDGTTSGQRIRDYFQGDVDERALEQRREWLESTRETRDDLAAWHGRTLAVKTALPKTAETIALLQRWLIDRAELPDMTEGDGAGATAQVTVEDTEERDIPPELRRYEQRRMTERMQNLQRERSAWWIIGTSLAFEFVVVGLAALRFCRRDF